MYNHLQVSSECVNQGTVHTMCEPSSGYVEEFLLSLMEKLKRIAWKYSERREDREDLVSIGVVAIMEAIRKNDLFEKRSPVAYALVVAEHAMTKRHDLGYAGFLRCSGDDGRLSTVLSLDMLLDDDDTNCLYEMLIDDQISSCHGYEEVYTALSRLTVVQREAVGYQYGFPGYGKQTARERARALGISEHAVGARYCRALKVLREDKDLCKAVGVEVKG